MMHDPARTALTAAVFLATTATLLAQAPAPPPRRVALLVGVNVYDRRGFVDLKWAENDVEAMGKELGRLGFDRVVVMKGSATGAMRASRKNIETQLESLLGGVGKQDVVLVMLSGHGQQLEVRGEGGKAREDGFYCPVDAAINEPATMVSLSRLTDETLNTWGGKNLVLVDACRDGAVDADRGVRTRGVQGRVVALPEGTAILFSCAAGQKSVELDKLGHGAFSQAVLEVLRATVPGETLTWGALVDRAQARVEELNPRQQPISSGTIGRLLLAGRGTPGAATLPRIVSGPTSRLQPEVKDTKAFTPPKVVAFAASIEPRTARPGEVVHLRVLARMDPGYFLYKSFRSISKGKEEVGGSLDLDLFNSGGLPFVGDWVPSREATKQADAVFVDGDSLVIWGYDDEVSFSIPLLIPPDAQPGPRTLRLQVGYMLASDKVGIPRGRWTLPNVTLNVVPSP